MSNSQANHKRNTSRSTDGSAELQMHSEIFISAELLTNMSERSRHRQINIIK